MRRVLGRDRGGGHPRGARAEQDRPGRGLGAGPARASASRARSPVSALTGEGVEGLLEVMGEAVPHPPLEVTLLVPWGREDVTARLYREAEVLGTEPDGEGTIVRALVGRAGAGRRPGVRSGRSGAGRRRASGGADRPRSPDRSRPPRSPCRGPGTRSSANRSARSCSRAVSGSCARACGRSAGSVRRVTRDLLGLAPHAPAPRRARSGREGRGRRRGRGRRAARPSRAGGIPRRSPPPGSASASRTLSAPSRAVTALGPAPDEHEQTRRAGRSPSVPGSAIAAATRLGHAAEHGVVEALGAQLLREHRQREHRRRVADRVGLGGLLLDGLDRVGEPRARAS